MSDEDAVEVDSTDSTDATDSTDSTDATDATDATDSTDATDDSNAGGESGGDGTADDVPADETPEDGDELADGTPEDDDTPSLSERVAEYDADLGDEVADLASELDERREEVDELTSKLARVRADFSNYKQRAKRKREEIRERASESLVERIVPIRNDLLRALDQEAGSDIRPGVESTLEKFDEVLDEEGVQPIHPDPGAAVDPSRHQVMLRVDSDQPEGSVHEVYEPGYAMGDRVIAEAQVTVSDGGE